MADTIFCEAYLACYSLGTGAGLLMVYDGIRLFRMICPHRRFWVNLEDFFYWIYCGAMTFGMLYRLNDGGLRGYAIAGTLAGMAGYQYLVSRKLLKCLKKGQEYFTIRARKRRRRTKRVKK